MRRRGIHIDVRFESKDDMLVMSGIELTMRVRATWFVAGALLARMFVDRAGATKLLRWQPCRLAAHGRRGGVPMKRSERRWPEKNALVFPY
jgi:hypothetical protein